MMGGRDLLPDDDMALTFKSVQSVELATRVEDLICLKKSSEATLYD